LTPSTTALAPASGSPLDGLLAVAAALRTSPDLGPTLDRLAESIAATLGVATATINLYRPAFHDFETVAVHGSDDARATLLGSRSPAEEWAQLIDERFEHRGAYFIRDGEFDWDGDATLSYVPPIPPSDDPEAWRAEDALFVPLRSSAGVVLGVLSVDEPKSGKRPSDRDLDVLVGVATQAGLAIESAQHAQAAQRHRADVQQLLRVSSRLNSEHSREGIARAACEGIRDALGFERVAMLLRSGDSLVPVAGASWPGGMPTESSTIAELAQLLAPETQIDGCVLLTREEARSRTPERLHRIYSSRRNGRGPHGWDHHWLLVPLQDEDGRLIGLIWPEDPVDRLIPTPERLRTLRAFANQAVSALDAFEQRERLRHLAEHDPLTGLRNRRHLSSAIDAAIVAAGPEGVAVVVADADGFKRVNDELGYMTGDAVLKGIAGVISEALPLDGFAARLGGEEFAIVLPRTDASRARLIAEALRHHAHEAIDVPWGLTLSVGLAATGAEVRDGDALLRAATRALSVAKKLGRDRAVVYDPVTLESLLDTLDGADGRGAEQLSAVLLLAETLDLRDAGTARHSQTVGRYSEQIAGRMGFAPEAVERIKIGGLLHDIGKLAVADAILHKPGALEPDEWAEVRRHAEVGARICSHAGLRDIASWVLAHHERWAGGGYPHGIAGGGIPLEARILSVADAYEAMTAVRPYRTSPLDAEAAQQELRDGAGTQFDPEVVEAFLAVLAGE
jgi:diguanylate cyclase (GGDEF)-like protein/putative nucleotidyltransferase with HDIG domain